MVATNVNPSEKYRNRAAWISAIASVFIFLIKMGAYRLTGSAAVLSDALESIVNVVASIVALFVIRFASQPADAEHPYGHGKAEYFSAAFEGGLIFFAALMIIGESLKALINHEPAQKLELGVLIIGGAAFLNLLLGVYLKQMGKKHHSEALQASGAHVISDVTTTVGVMVGLGLVLWTKIEWLDPAIAILVGLQLAFQGFKIVRQSWGGLLDEMDEGSLENLTNALQKNRMPGIIDIHHLRIIRSGSFHHVDAHLVVPEFWNMLQAHNETHDFERKVVQDYPVDGEIAFHLDPCKKSFCEICDLENCPIRRVPFKTLRPFTVKSLTGGPAATNPLAYENANRSN
ncbi:cation diffusion facilitator family transporter [Bdellovibrio svalbardensis]|uniref:Cation diffusion facilitator family transporter n=1 Tax=Bdellovibrio svalbardensis TaxID=2972972 RepID=A0ABT6DKW5_9BACT|nr:cation diffusion facilitator family transporter [Bdellovibrio svalbardensis]MDG0817157.1 cation diffusion facilitator family transporter [Bdellovibrio svalbardensis]